MEDIKINEPCYNQIKTIELSVPTMTFLYHKCRAKETFNETPSVSNPEEVENALMNIKVIGDALGKELGDNFDRIATNLQSHNGQHFQPPEDKKNTKPLTDAIEELFNLVGNTEQRITSIQNCLFVLINRVTCNLSQDIIRNDNKYNLKNNEDSTKNIAKIKLKPIEIINLLKEIDLMDEYGPLYGKRTMLQLILTLDYNMKLVKNKRYYNQLNTQLYERINAVRDKWTKWFGMGKLPIEHDEIREILGLLHVQTIQKLKFECTKAINIAARTHLA